MTQFPPKYLTAHNFLHIVTKLVALYGIGMVIAGRTLALPLFDGLGFGPNARGLAQDGVDYSIFAFAVLGALIVGWMGTFSCLLDLAVVEDSQTRKVARRGMILSVCTWFVLDTGYSIVTGEVEHAAFNLPFVSLLGFPLYALVKNDPGKKRS